VVRLRAEEGSLLILRRRHETPLLAFRHRDGWLLLVLVVILAWTVATALDRSAWVAGSDVLIPAMFLATCLGWLLAISPISGRFFLLACVAAVGALLLLYTPPHAGARMTTFSVQAIVAFGSSLSLSTAQLLLAGLVALVVASGLWTAWWTFRRRHGLAALLPSGSILAVEVLNDTSPLMYFLTALWLALAATILLRLNFVALKDHWRIRRVPRASDTGWNFGEVGSEAIVMVLAVAFILPPLSSADVSSLLVPGTVHTVEFHPFGIGAGGVGVGRAQVGYSETVHPGAQLDARPSTVMFVSGSVNPLYPYWRGIALGGWDGISWYQLRSSGGLAVRSSLRVGARQTIPRSDLPADPRLTREVDISVQTLVPASTLDATVFSAGEPVSVDSHPVNVRGILDQQAAPPAPFSTVDHVQLADSPRTPYGYAVKAVVTVADVASLRKASTDYPAWIDPYRTLYWQKSAGGYAAQDDRILLKAEQIVQGAGATNPYDQAKAIESWFLAKGNFTYTLKPPPAPQGVRPLDYFLFQSHRGYCQDFATAMAVMLRQLGIPSRLESGFGLGGYDDRTHRYLVSTTDAHTWVEAYFPGYGWIPFEPTPDNLNFPVVRPLTASQSVPQTSAAGGAASRPPNARLGELSQDGGSAPVPSLSTVEKQLALVAAGILLLVLIVGLLLLRWLMAPSDIPRVWRRLLFLNDRLGVPRHPGDTPSELGARLSTAVPELAPELRTLAALYTRARFRRGGLTGLERVEVRRSWLRVRRRYAGLLLDQLRPRRGGGGLRSGAAGRAGSRGPGSRLSPARPGPGGSAGSGPLGARP